MLNLLHLNIRRAFQSFILLTTILRVMFTMTMQLIFVLFLCVVIELSQTIVNLLVNLFGLKPKE